MLFNAFAPPFSLVGGYFLSGFWFLFLSFIFYFFFDVDVVLELSQAAFFHIFLAGFVCSIIIGALYQLASVILVRSFYSLRGAYLVLFLYFIGLNILAFGMYFGEMILINVGAIIFFIALFYFFINYYLTLMQRGKFNYSTFALSASSFYLILGILCGAGLILILNGVLHKDFYDLLKFHIYFVVGFIYFVIAGSSSVLIPMFALSHKTKFYLFWLSSYLFILACFTLFFSEELSIYLILLSFILFVIMNIKLLQSRVRKAYDYWNLNLVFSIISIFLSSIFYYFGQYDLVFSFLLYGFLYSFIVANTYKIMPFLIWYHYLAKFVGKTKERLPLMDDMVLRKVANISLVFNVIALILRLFNFNYLFILFICISGILFLVNIYHFILFIKFTPELKDGIKREDLR